MITLYIVLWSSDGGYGNIIRLVRAFYSEQRAKDFISNSTSDSGSYYIERVEWYVE